VDTRTLLSHAGRDREGNSEWEIIGPPEIRDVDLHARYFTPFRVTPHGEAMRIFEPAPQTNPHRGRLPAMDAIERFLTTLFLRSSRTARDIDTTRRCREPRNYLAPFVRFDRPVLGRDD